MDYNIIYNEDCVVGMSKYLKDSCVDLIIADPPYFKVAKEKWDYCWRTEGDYLKWSRDWICEAARVLRLGGTLYIFGYFRILAYLLPLIESFGFKFKQQIVLNKGIQSVSGRATKKYKMFPNTTESVMMFYKDSRPFIKNLLLSRQKELNKTAREINEALGVKSNGGGMWSIYTGENVCEQIPTKEIWEKLQVTLDFNYPYENIEQVFNPQMGYTDVWNMCTYKIEKRIHPTQKPEEIIERMILASSHENDVVLDPFIGSGITAKCAKKTNRKYLGFESDVDYYQAALDFIQ